jgi:isoamylase
VAEMGVDGFRFDLASALGRGAVDFDPRAAFFAAIAQDPLLSTVKLIAEPWDLGPGGYRVGGYPHGWAEWNGAYRDTVRSFWCQRDGHLTQLAQRLCGSADIYEPGGRLPTDSINLVTVHDGFTLADLTAYNHKHNEANGEDNRDGENHNRGWNGGFEGPTDDELVQAQRARMRRNLLATLLLSQGTPLLLGGDESGRSQRGNNNGYCQDNDLSWLDWQPTPEGQRLQAFTEHLLALRRALPSLRRPRFFTGRPGPDGEKDITWRLPDGSEMPAERWHDPGLTAVAAHLSRWAAVDDEEDADDEGADVPPVLLLINGGDEPAHFQLPPGDAAWRVRIDTCTASGLPARGDAPLDSGCTASGWSIVLLTQDARGDA